MAIFDFKCFDGAFYIQLAALWCQAFPGVFEAGARTALPNDSGSIAILGPHSSTPLSDPRGTSVHFVRDGALLEGRPGGAYPPSRPAPCSPQIHHPRTPPPALPPPFLSPSDPRAVPPSPRPRAHAGPRRCPARGSTLGPRDTPKSYYVMCGSGGVGSKSEIHIT